MVRALGRWLGMEHLGAPEHRSLLHCALFIALLAAGLRLAFWAYTGRIWDDALIALLHSENAAAGLGLTHVHPGHAPVQGFTSPIAVLIALAGECLVHGLGLVLLRLASVLAAVLTVIYLLAIGRRPGTRIAGPLLVLVMGYAALEHQQILYGMAGMETQFAVLFTLASFYYLSTEKPRALGIVLGLCLWTRPDFALWCLICGVYVLIRSPRQLPVVVGFSLLIYLPWLLFATAYYGSPVPNSLVAKAVGYPVWWEHLPGDGWVAGLWRHTRIRLMEVLMRTLAPVFEGHGAVHRFFSDRPESPLVVAVVLLAALGGAVALRRRQFAWWPVLAFVVIYGAYYLYAAPMIFGWYKPPYVIMVLLCTACGLQWLLSWLPRDAWRQRGGMLLAAAYLLPFTAVLPMTFETERQIQHEIERPGRQAAGLYLREHAPPGATVGCEPLGYIGYFSRHVVYDWPGLCSPEVLAWSRSVPRADRSLENMLKALQPDYLFLRDTEFLYFFHDRSWIYDGYYPVARFRADPEDTKTIRWVNRNANTDYHLYQKKTDGRTPDYDWTLWPVHPGQNAPPDWTGDVPTGS